MILRHQLPDVIEDCPGIFAHFECHLGSARVPQVGADPKLPGVGVAVAIRVGALILLVRPLTSECRQGRI